MTPGQEAVFERNANRYFRSHREIPNGRDFRWNSYRYDNYHSQDGRPILRFRNNFDSVFPDAPGAGI